MQECHEERILKILASSDTSLAVGKIADLAEMHRITAAKYLAVLEARGSISRRDVGKAKLYWLAKEGRKNAKP